MLSWLDGGAAPSLLLDLSTAPNFKGFTRCVNDMPPKDTDDLFALVDTNFRQFDNESE